MATGRKKILFLRGGFALQHPYTNLNWDAVKLLATRLKSKGSFSFSKGWQGWFTSQTLKQALGNKRTEQTKALAFG